MKKATTIAILIVSFLIVYFLQANFFSWFTIAGVKPNLFVIFILFISLFAGSKVGIPFGILVGLFLDKVLGKNIGSSFIMLTIVAVVGGYFDKNFSKESRITIMLMVMGSTILYEVGGYILQIIEQSIYIEIVPFLTKLGIEVIYNAILTIILYPIMQKWGYKIENTFKGQKILTRYF